jgi:hypothetical protein
LPRRRCDFVDQLQRTGYSVSERQLDRWVARVDAGEPAISAEKASGAAAALSSEQRALLAGWVLHQNHVSVSVRLTDYRAAAQAVFGHTPSLTQDS